MNKKIPLLTLLCLLTILSACSNSNGNLIDTGSVTEGSWVSYDGKVVKDEEMRSSEPIDYDPSNEYEINRSSYVSYYNGDEFIETIQYSDDPPMTLDTIEEADIIVISFNQYNEDTISLTEAK
ncbi:hypothetical protein LNK15_00430 [Jeotgalicoccus huakuii]|nr:hypothetical protein [Jeotgalicoccus huakuii]